MSCSQALAHQGIFWHQTQKKDDEIACLNKDLDTAEKMTRAVKKKYIQEKAKLGTCMRVKMAEESKRVKYQKQVQVLTLEKEALAAQNAVLEEKTQIAFSSYVQKIEKLREILKTWATRYDSLVGKYKELAQADREKSGQIQMLERDKKGLKADVSRLEKRLARNFKNNQRLCEIAEELTDKYRDAKKNHGEPFTKIGMIELEHLLQEYIKRIDKEKLVTE